MDNQYQIVDNFMPEDSFELLSSTIMSSNFPWYYLPLVNYLDDDSQCLVNRYFEHNFFTYYEETESYGKSFRFDDVKSFLDLLEINKLYRVKSNLFTSTESLVQYAFHCDQPFKHKGAILYLNDCDGYTVLQDGTKIESVANRCLLFDSSKPHASTTCTNQKARFNINVNYS